MKKLTFISAALMAMGGLIMGGCDSVSEPDRFVPAEIVPMRAVLLEEYTGQECTNCPDGHIAIKEISASLGDSVVPVGIHASGLAIPAPVGYKTATGEEYYKAAGSPALPTAVINMQTAPLQVSDWGAAINNIIMTPTPFTVKAEGKVNDSDYDISVAICAGDDYEGRLMVWVVENDLIGRQLDHGTLISDYEHQHVFRAAVTEDIWGEPVTLKAHEAQYLDFSCPIGARWNKDNIYVVAFLYNDQGVAQVTASASHH